MSKYLSLFFVLALTVMTEANATNVHILQANLESWFTMDPKKPNPPMKDMTPYMNNGQFDFITTQENDYPLNVGYGLSPNYQLAGFRQDASIFYDATRWTPVNNSFKTIAMTADGGGGRVFAYSQFKNLKGEVVTIATTHLCIDWGKGDCIGGQINAHKTDANTIGTTLQPFAGPVFFTGDLNSLADSTNQGLSIESILAKYNLQAVKSNGTFIGPTFQSSIIDFIYSRNATLQKAYLYSRAQGNQSDHSAIDATFKISDN